MVLDITFDGSTPRLAGKLVVRTARGFAKRSVDWGLVDIWNPRYQGVKEYILPNA